MGKHAFEIIIIQNFKEKHRNLMLIFYFMKNHFTFELIYNSCFIIFPNSEFIGLPPTRDARYRCFKLKASRSFYKRSLSSFLYIYSNFGSSLYNGNISGSILHIDMSLFYNYG